MIVQDLPCHLVASNLDREAVEAGHNKSAAVSPLSACLRNPPDNMETLGDKNREG